MWIADEYKWNSVAHVGPRDVGGLTETFVSSGLWTRTSVVFLTRGSNKHGKAESSHNSAVPNKHDVGHSGNPLRARVFDRCRPPDPP